VTALNSRRLPYLRPPTGEPILPGDTVDDKVIGAFGLEANNKDPDEDPDEDDDLVFWEHFRHCSVVPPEEPRVSLADLQERLATEPDFLGRLGEIVLEPPGQIWEVSTLGSNLAEDFSRLTGPLGPASCLKNAEGEEVPLIPPIMEAVAQRGHQVWVVGGAVRDTILARGVKDIDLAGTLPAGAFCASGRKAVETYEVGGYAIRWRVNPKSHVCRLIRNGLTDVPANRLLEYKPLVARDYPLPASGCSLTDDVATRDLTINCLFYDRKHSLVLDPSGEGITDLPHLLLRTPNKQQDAFEIANVAFRGLKLMLKLEYEGCSFDASPLQQWLDSRPSSMKAELEKDGKELALKYRINLGSFSDAEVDRTVAHLGESAVALVQLARKGASQ
jgi:hypothetical protein